MNEFRKLSHIFLLSLFLFLPSLFNYFTNDDFFHLKIAKANNFVDVINYFNPISAPSGFGHFRPLTTQVFYGIDYLFGLNPIILHIISYLVFFAVCWLVYKLIYQFSNEKVALVGTFLYATSVTHFGHLYYLGAFQELGLALFFFGGILTFIKFLKTEYLKYEILTTLAFIGALLSKESAVIFLPTLVLVYIFFRISSKINFNKLLSFLILNSLILILYIYLHSIYGFAKGDSYLFDFSKRVFNTIFWYFLWSLNLPEMLVDFIGPGLNVSSNLIKYYGSYITPIVITWGILVTILGLIKLRNFKNIIKEKKVYFFCLFWFLITSLPFIFLPWHKFSFELTVPLFGIVLSISFLIKNEKTKIIAMILFLWILTSLLTNILTYKTNWIITGGKAAKNMKDYIDKNYISLEGKTILFYDSTEDIGLPWKPSLILQEVLSDQNFFDVFYNGNIKAKYGEEIRENVVPQKARIFLNY